MNNEDLAIMNARFFDNVKFAITSKNMKICDVEKAVGLSKGYLSRRGNISLLTAYQISKIIDIDLTQLIENNLVVDLEIKKQKEKIGELESYIEKLEKERL